MEDRYYRKDRYTFADSETGLTMALYVILTQRRHGFKTRMVTKPVKLTQGIYGETHTVIATPPARPNRAARGCNILKGETNV
jgi:hypothetical protein